MSNRLANYRRRNAPRRAPTAVVVRDNITIRGGINLIDSARDIDPGEFLIARNYEPYFANGAPERVAGHEVFDGRPQPHKAEYWKVDLTAITGGPFVVGETVTATPSGETGVVARYVPDEDSSNAGYLIVTELSDEVEEDETWTGSTSSATGTSAYGSDFQGEPTEDNHDLAQLAAETIRRNNITKVGESISCSGPVRGVCVYQNVVYAFRDDETASTGTMWKSTSSGWEQVNLGFKIRFAAGSTPIVEGDTVTGATSGATAEVKRVVVKDGFWAGGDAEGYIVTDAITGTFSTAEDLEVSSTKYAETDPVTASEAQILNAGGLYKFRVNNFGGHTKTTRMYGVNGVDNAFEFDGTTFVQIETGMSDDAPTQIGVHRGHLLLAFSGGSLQHSGKNQPLSFSIVTGANELLAGDEITGFIEEIGDVTFVFTRNKTFRLEGFVQENIQLKLHNLETGAFENSIQRIGRSMYLDDRGFTSIPTTDRFGDFASNTVSAKIDPLVQGFITESTVVGSCISRTKSLYRCFFENGEAISIGFSGNKVNGCTTIALGINVNCTANGEIVDAIATNGKERIFAGANDGYVYELDVGRNFNGDEIEAYFVLAYHFSGNPEYSKRYRRLTLYLEAEGRASIDVLADYDYNEDPLNFETILSEAIPLGGGRYGISRHGNFNYSRASKTDIRATMNSHARNVSLIVYTKEANEEPHRVYGLTYHISRRRMIRH